MSVAILRFPRVVRNHFAVNFHGLPKPIQNHCHRHVRHPRARRHQQQHPIAANHSATVKKLTPILRDLWWLAAWAVVSVVFWNWLGSSNPDTNKVALFFGSVIAVIVCSAWICGIVHGCSARWWIAGLVAAAVTTRTQRASTKPQTLTIQNH